MNDAMRQFAEMQNKAIELNNAMMALTCRTIDRAHKENRTLKDTLDFPLWRVEKATRTSNEDCIRIRIPIISRHSMRDFLDCLETALKNSEIHFEPAHNGTDLFLIIRDNNLKTLTPQSTRRFFYTIIAATNPGMLGKKDFVGFYLDHAEKPVEAPTTEPIPGRTDTWRERMSALGELRPKHT